MPSNAGRPSNGTRRKTPLFPPEETLNFRSSSKSSNVSRVAIHFDPGLPVQRSTPPSTVQLSIGPRTPCQPARLYPSNSDFHPSSPRVEPAGKTSIARRAANRIGGQTALMSIAIR